MLDQIYTTAKEIERHRQAPLVAEREEYLRHLQRQGYTHDSLIRIASYMLHVIRFLALRELRVVEMAELKQAADSWADYRASLREPGQRRAESAEYFMIVARPWLRFHGKLAPPPLPPFRQEIEIFANAMLRTCGLSPATVSGYSNRAHGFLKWLASRGGDLATMSFSEIDAFLAEKRAAGWKPRGIATQCQAMRSFFGFAETQGWCQPDFSMGIKSPRIPKYEAQSKGPSWSHVRQLLKLADGPKPEHLRAKAMLLLFTTYGLRSSEVVGLRLDDFDWRNEVFTVRRAKRGGIQQFPIQYETGEAILAYLRFGRPRVGARHVFLSKVRPFGPLSSSIVWSTVGKRLRKLNLDLDHVGPHALRHACATRLLQKGTSLKEIAEFLGHHDTNSVGIYAKYDVRALSKVAAFRLAGLR